MSRKPPLVLQPVNPSVAVFPHYITQQGATLQIKELSFTLSGDDFSVIDQNGAEVVQCSGKTFSISDRKVITDPQGNVLFHLQTELLSLPKSFIAKDALNQPLFRIQRTSFFSTKMEVLFTNHSTGQMTTLEFRGDWMGFSGDLAIKGGPPLARVVRKYGLRDFSVGHQTYYVNVASGVDLALIAAVCICFDEIKHERRKR